MHYIYIHRYTINYNKVREAHRISPRFHFYLDKILYLSNNGLVNFLACFCNTCYNTELGGLFSSYKKFQGGNFICALGNTGRPQMDDLCRGGRDGETERRQRWDRQHNIPRLSSVRGERRHLLSRCCLLWICEVWRASDTVCRC